MTKAYFIVLLVVFFQCATTSAAAQMVASASSPGDVLKVEVAINEGRASYQIKRFDEVIIASSQFGFLLRNTEKFERNLALESKQESQFDETWEQPWGESRFVRNHYRELRMRLREQTKLKRGLDVVFRVFDDGVGFRYEFPAQSGFDDVIIDDELTEFVVADPATAWWIPAGEWNRYEYLYQKTPLTQVTQAHTPMTLRTDDGVYIAFHEAALVNYSSMWLRRVEDQRFKAQLSPAAEGWKVRRSAPFVTPWRTLQIADSAAGLYVSNLILNLNEPNKLGDVSWFKPSKYVGIWWSLHLDQETWATGKRLGATTANAKRYVDFAAKHGFRGLLIEGWNPGWDGEWFANGWNFDFTKAVPAFDFKAVTDYALSKNVHLIGHHETACAVSHYEKQLDAALDLYASGGVDVIKTGYVCDAGQIERYDENKKIVRDWHDGQWMSRHHLRVVEAAAKRKIAVNPHEPIKDTGLRRTYPNWVSREGARGMEYAAWGNPPNPPEHEANLVFTRMLSGPMDFTPGIVSLQGRGQPVQTTKAKQLALYVVLYSPIQMIADLPENYAKHSDVMPFLEAVPTDWSDTRVLNGEIGDYVTMARKDRNSEDWYLGAITDESGRVLDVPLSFLDSNQVYTAEIYRDGDGAHWKNAPFKFTVETKKVTASDTLKIKLAAGGGQAIRFKKM